MLVLHTLLSGRITTWGVSIPQMLLLLGSGVIYRLVTGGKVGLAGTLFILLTMAALWITLFTEPLPTGADPLIIVDTIAFLFVLLVLSSLISSTRKVFVTFFALANIVLLVLFSSIIRQKFGYPGATALEFLLDNLFATALVVIMTNRLRRVNQEALVKANQEVERNEELMQTLEQRVQDRTTELKKAQEKLIDRAHREGQADIAASVLHNVGNILNSVSTSVDTTSRILKNNNLSRLHSANALLREHMASLADFIQNDPRGVKLMHYYLQLGEVLEHDVQQISHNCRRAGTLISSANDVIHAQQQYATAGIEAQPDNLVELLEGVLSLLEISLARHDITLQKNFSPVAPVIVQKQQFIHIVLNILKNARESLQLSAVKDKCIQLTIEQRDTTRVTLTIADNGVGIAPHHLQKIFSFGFTTKKDGHGFGMHACANYMQQMGGSISVHSDGETRGAAFTLSFKTAT
jgi:signal transduction histidine kinase